MWVSRRRSGIERVFRNSSILMPDQMESPMLPLLRISGMHSKRVREEKIYLHESICFSLRMELCSRNEPVLMLPSSQHQALRKMRRKKETPRWNKPRKETSGILGWSFTVEQIRIVDVFTLCRPVERMNMTHCILKSICMEKSKSYFCWQSLPKERANTDPQITGSLSQNTQKSEEGWEALKETRRRESKEIKSQIKDRTSISHHKEPIWMEEGTLPRAHEEYRTLLWSLCTCESLYSQKEAPLFTSSTFLKSYTLFISSEEERVPIPEKTGKRDTQ